MFLPVPGPGPDYSEGLSSDPKPGLPSAPLGKGSYKPTKPDKKAKKEKVEKEKEERASGPDDAPDPTASSSSTKTPKSKAKPKCITTEPEAKVTVEEEDDEVGEQYVKWKPLGFVSFQCCQKVEGSIISLQKLKVRLCR
ncbi:unnamed protein product [Symbiodinium sp. CCMP2592]|nr:unnamed protein product [Symbiodinium sp. CCMP2592]